jgi:D-beta-D-heptose 7-phosphate kinase/D-beta-D-heptose 1-phosphate adenosyltransferase
MLGIKTFIDPKGNNWEKYRGANLVKPNVKELGDVLGFEIENKDDIIVEYGRMILTQYDIDYLLITRSEKGMTLLHENEALHIHSEAKEVYDVSGAGDTVIATLVLGLIEGKDIQDAIHLANVAAGVVVGKFGTATVSRKELGIQLRIQ